MSDSEDDEIYVYPNAVEVGYCEPFEEDFQIWFGGKIGGKPIWLNPRDLPLSKDLMCIKCGNPLKFLLQVYYYYVFSYIYLLIMIFLMHFIVVYMFLFVIKHHVLKMVVLKY